MSFPPSRTHRRARPSAAAGLLAFALAPLVTGCNDLGPSETEAEFWARMDAFVTERMNPAGAGFGIVVIRDGDIAFAKGWGMANIQTGVPFSPETPSSIASLTKQFTAMAVLMLYEREMLTLETRVRSILPELPAGRTSRSTISLHINPGFPTTPTLRETRRKTSTD